MSKTLSISSNSEHYDGDVYEVEKIINYKIINGKKFYKVIWAGYSFQEATWEPEENLKCPEKINQFIRRYQDVIKRKNLMKKDTYAPTLHKLKVDQPQKLTIEKTQPLQKPHIMSRQSYLDKDKIQNSTQKSSLTHEKTVPDIENLKQKIMKPLPSTDKQKNQSSLQPTYLKKKENISEMNAPNEMRIFPIKALNIQIASKDPQEISDYSQVTKVIKIQSLSQTKSDTLSHRMPMKLEQNLQTNLHQNDFPLKFENSRKPFFHNTKTRKNEKNHNNPHTVFEISQEKEVDSEQSESSMSTGGQTKSQPKQQDVFLNFGQRLDIERILCPMEIQNQQNTEFQDAERQGKRTFQYFLIKNKFSLNQKMVQRERIINEQPLKLIEYYEALLIK